MEAIVGYDCFSCGSPWVHRDLECGVCLSRAYRYAWVDGSDAELIKLRLLGNDQRKERERKKWQEALDAATGVDY